MNEIINEVEDSQYPVPEIQFQNVDQLIVEDLNEVQAFEFENTTSSKTVAFDLPIDNTPNLTNRMKKKQETSSLYSNLGK